MCQVRFTTCVLLAALSLTSARAQTLNCSTIASASEYGTDMSICQMADQSSLRCTQDKGGLSYCKVEHANGFVSQSGEGAGDALAALIGWMVRTHQQRVTNKAVNDVAASVLLLMKDSMLEMDMSTLMGQLASHVPLEQREPGIEASNGFATLSLLTSKTMSDLFAGSSQADNYSYYRMRKEWGKFHDTALVDVCQERAEDRLITRGFDSIHAGLPADITQALEAIRADDALLEPECSSERATKLLQKQHAQTQTSK